MPAPSGSLSADAAEVAIVDGDFTLKELVLEKGRFALKPHNPSYPLIVPVADLEIFGVMVGLVRRFQS